MPSLISKDQRENTICTMVDVRGDVSGLPHGTTPVAIIANKNNTEINILMRKGMGYTAVSATKASSVTL